MDELTRDEEAAYEELQRRGRDTDSSMQPQYEDTNLPSREYEDS